jgi:hypothetical protein
VPIERHPLPQQIASYEFQLVGEMTLRQFAFLGGGLTVAFLIYLSGMPGLVKWPLIIGSAALGAAFAFVPLNDQPLTRWVVIFFKSIFSPTQLIWQKRIPQAEAIQPKPSAFAPPKAAKAMPIIQKKPAVSTRLMEYFQAFPQPPAEEMIDKQEAQRASRIVSMFQSVTTPTVPYIPPIPRPIPQQPISPPTPRPIPSLKPPTPKIIPQKPQFVPPIQPATKPSVAPAKVVLPEAPWKAEKPTVEAKTSTVLPFPHPPTDPNILTGMVLGKNGEIIEGAIIEIRDEKGLPVRALKTNKLGQFQTVTPLQNGAYEIETEKEGYQFEILRVSLSGNPISPIEIRAKKLLALSRQPSIINH